MKWRGEVFSYKSELRVHSPQFSGAVIACSILKEREGIAPPVYFLGSGTCCSEGGIYVCGVPSTGNIFIINFKLVFIQVKYEWCYSHNKMDLHIKVTQIWLEDHQLWSDSIQACPKYSFQHHVHKAKRAHLSWPVGRWSALSGVKYVKILLDS